MDIEEPDSVMRELSNRRKLIEQLRTEKWELRKKILTTRVFLLISVFTNVVLFIRTY